MSVYINEFKTMFDSKSSIQALRNKVLELAIQGKLVPQDPNDEPASEILGRINEERGRMYKDGKNKAVAGIAKSMEIDIACDLPDGWVWTRLCDIALINPTNRADDDADASFVPMRLIEDGYNNSHEFENMKWKDIKKGFTHFMDGDIGVAKITPCFENRKSVVFKKLNNGIGAGTTELHILRRYDKLMPSEYLLLVAKSNRFITSGVQTYTGTAGQQRVGKAFIESFVIGLPPIKEQHRIVAKVESLMSEIDKLEKALEHKKHLLELLPKAVVDAIGNSKTGEELNENLKFVIKNFETVFQTPESMQELRNVILQLAIEGKLVPQDPNDEPASELVKKIHAERERLVKEGTIKKQKPLELIGEDDIPFEIPGSWEWISLNSLADFIDYRGKTPNKTTTGIPLITAKNIKWGFISTQPEEFINEKDYDDWMTRGIPHYGNVVFTTEAPLANVARLFRDDKYALAQRAITFRTHLSSVDAFLLVALMSDGIRKMIFEKATGTTVLGIKASRLKELIIPLPPLAEQHRIVAKVESMMTLIDQIEQTLVKKKKIIQMAAETITA